MITLIENINRRIDQMLGVPVRRRPEVRRPVRQHLVPDHRLPAGEAQRPPARPPVHHVQKSQTERSVGVLLLRFPTTLVK